jgi:hypothetical protein
MNCKQIRELLSEGRPLTQAAKDHLALCGACRAMIETLMAPEVELDRERVDQFQRIVTTSLRPVRPLPSNRTLIAIFLTLFTAFSLVAAIPAGYIGFHSLSVQQRLAYYLVISLCAIWFAVTTTQQMIPGSRRTAHSRWVIVAALLSVALVSVALFHNFDLDRFVRLGIPCLRLGSICALLSGALFWFILRKGFFTSPVEASTIAGFFAGLAGVAVLALHCPIQNSAHIIVWHLGAMVLGGLGGAVLGTLRR